MPEAWIRLRCPACNEQWEANPGDVPPPGSEFECNHCGGRRSISEFVQTDREFKILKRFHEV